MRELGLVHHHLVERVELARLREEVGEVVRGADEGDLELEALDHVPDEEVPPLHVLHPVVVLRVVGHVARGLRVGGEARRAGLGVAEAADELAEVHDVLRGLGERDDLRLVSCSNTSCMERSRAGGAQ